MAPPPVSRSMTGCRAWKGMETKEVETRKGEYQTAETRRKNTMVNNAKSSVIVGGSVRVKNDVGLWCDGRSEGRRQRMDRKWCGRDRAESKIEKIDKVAEQN